MKRLGIALACATLIATVACGDEWDDAMAVPETVAAVPEHLWFHYVSTYYVKPVTFAAEDLPVKGHYRFEVRPVECFGKKGAAIVSEHVNVA